MLKKHLNNILLLLLSITFGVLLLSQLKQNNEDYDLVSLQSIQVMKNEVSNNKKEIENLKKLISEKEIELDRYEHAISDHKSIVGILRDELDKIKMLAAVTDIHGPGITIKMEDNVEGYTEGEDMNYYLVHDMDVTIILNDLKAAGAEAISINGKRLLVDTEVFCNGPIIIINDEVVAAPFIIKAIGDPKVLYAAINAPNTYGWELKETYDIKIETQIWDDLPIPGYVGKRTFEYAQKVNKEGE